MRQWLTGEDLVNWLVMLRTTDSRTYVILEGSSDCQALDPHIDEVSALSFPAHSKSVATRAMSLIEQRSIVRVLAIVDRDWDGMLNPPVDLPNVVYTDLYDLEATAAFAGGTLQRVISSHCLRERREEDIGPALADAESQVTLVAATVGLMRYVSERDRLGIKCEGFPVHEALSNGSAAIDLEKMAVIAIARSDHATVDEAALVAAIKEELRASHDLQRVCNGHDLASSTSVLVNRWGGRTSRAAIEQAVRSGLGSAELAITRMYEEVAAWCGETGGRVWSMA